MSEEEIQYGIMDEMPVRQDVLINYFEYGIEAIDINTLKAYREAFASFHPDSEMNKLDDLSFLTRIGAFVRDKDGKEGLTNGAILFFGKWENIIRIYPGYFLDYRYYDHASERWAKRFSSDDFSFAGNAYSFYLKVRELSATHLPNPFKRDKDGVTNIDGRDILEAVMEAVVNALSNAAYSLSYGVRVIQTPNSLLISNPGDIPVGETQAIRGGESFPRNTSILLFFRAIGKAERTGFGVPKIYEVSKRYGYPDPSFSVRKDFDITEMRISFLTLPYDTPSREAKLKLISFLASKRDGASVTEIMDGLSLSRSQSALLVRELLSSGILRSNLKEKKGRKIYLNDGTYY